MKRKQNQVQQTGFTEQYFQDAMKLFNSEAVSCGQDVVEILGLMTSSHADLTIAERFSLGAIKQTYRAYMRDWRENVVFMTEFCTALNHKIYEVALDHKHNPLADLYVELFEKVRNYCENTFTGEELRYLMTD